MFKCLGCNSLLNTNKTLKYKNWTFEDGEQMTESGHSLKKINARKSIKLKAIS